MSTPEPHGRMLEYAERVHAAALQHLQVIDGAMARGRGPAWNNTFPTQLSRYDALVKQLVAGAMGRPFMVDLVVRGRRKASRWRRYMESVVNEEKRPEVRHALRKAVGIGLGRPQGVGALKDLLQALVSGVDAYRAELLRLGADPSVLDQPAELLAEVEEAAREAGERQKQGDALRALAAAERSVTSCWVGDVWKAARRARNHARVKEDAAAEAAAMALLTDLEVAKKHALKA